MTAYVHDTQFFTRRTIVLFAIIALHLFIFWALATGLAQRAIEVIAPPIQTEIVQEEQKKVEPPPPPPPEFQKPPVEVPPPDVVVDLPPAPAQTTAISNVTTKHVEAAPPPKAGNKVGAKPGKNFPNTEDYYPPASQRLGEEGAANVHVCVAPTGKITEPPTIAQTSGSSRLDEGAIKLATAGSGRYQPATEDGKPIQDCFVFRIKFTMRK
jgi:periplasmic protein TonB